MATSPQRAYRAACPNCGAPVEFASAASASAVCGFCRSTLVREGDALRRIGISAELFDDHSPLQLGAGGKLQGVAFTLVGRLQYSYAEGTWNEWHALFDNGRSGWLSEDNGAYVFVFDRPAPADAPALDQLRAGTRCTADGRAWDVASVVRAKLLAAQGELPHPPRLEGEFLVVDLRNDKGEVGTLDNSDPAALHWSIGRSVPLSALAMTGLRDSNEKTLKGRSVECPSCGAALEIKLATTQSISCHQCRAVVDVSQGVGADLAHYAQANVGIGGLEPLIALGTTGQFAFDDKTPQPWQVVGYMERCDIPVASDDEQTFWREYLLYNRTAGFVFLVDSEEGWSWVKPLTGAPQVRGEGATWMGDSYRKRYTYPSKVTWVQGEFYWRVQQEDQVEVTDYESGSKRLSRERTGSEVTWSGGQAMSADAVAQGFGASDAVRKTLQRDASPATTAGSMGRGVMIAIFVIVVIIVLMAQCSSDRCEDVRNTFGAASAEYQQCVNSRSSGSSTSGGSYGGYSSGGGGHK